MQKNVLIYDCNSVRTIMAEPNGRKTVMAEWVDALANGPSVLVLKKAATDHAVIDQASG